MAHEQTIAELFARIDGVTLDGDAVIFHPEEIRVTGAVCDSTEHPDHFVVAAAFTATHPELAPDGIDDFAVGMGDNLEEAIFDATRVWLEGALLTIRHACKPDEECDCGLVDKQEMVTLPVDTQRPIVWDFYIGAMQGMGINDGDGGNNEDQGLMQAVLGVLSRELGQPRVIWVRAILTRYGTEVRAECMVNNEPWAPGIYMLDKVGHAWTGVSGMRMRRQFMVCRPTDRDPRPEIAAQIAERLTERNASLRTKRPWWQFWK